MQPFGRNRYGPKIVGCVPLGRGSWVPIYNVARAEAYLHTKFRLGPSNRLATVHERYRETGQTGQADRQRSDSIWRTVLQTVAQNNNTGSLFGLS